MRRHFRFLCYADQMTMFGFSVWPIPEYFGVGFAVILFYLRMHVYFSPRIFPTIEEEKAKWEKQLGEYGK